MLNSIEENSIVRIKNRSTRHRVYQTNHRSAQINWGESDTCWWPLDELEALPQGDLFDGDLPTLEEVRAANLQQAHTE